MVKEYIQRNVKIKTKLHNSANKKQRNTKREKKTSDKNKSEPENII